MANWVTYKVTDKIIYSRYIKFKLDGQVKYNKESESYIDLLNTLPFTKWDKGDEISVDTDKTCNNNRGKEFSFWDNVAYQISSHWEDKYWELLREKRDLESNSRTQLVLQRNTESDLSVVRAGINSLQIEKRNLEESNQSLQNQLTQKDRDIEWGKSQLALVQRSEREKQVRVEELTNQSTTLRIEDNKNKDKIRKLKGELGQSREEYLNQKIALKEEKLEFFIQRVGASRIKVMNLVDYYKQLTKARNEFNQTNIDLAENEINNIKQELLANGFIFRGISIPDTQKICRKCEKLAKLKLELNQVYQQYQAHQEQPINN